MIIAGQIKHIQLSAKLTNLDIGQRFLTTKFRVHLNPNFRESGLLQQQHLSLPYLECIRFNFVGGERGRKSQEKRTAYG